MFLKELIFPKICVGCGYLGVYICIECQKKLQSTHIDRCLYCNQPSYGGFTHARCQKKNGIDGFLALYKYNSFIQKCIKTIKYRLVTDLWKELGQIVAHNLIKRTPPIIALNHGCIIQPIPLNKNKLQDRGFNQSLLIANLLKKYFKMTIVDCLKRVKDTKMQSQLTNSHDRYTNIRGAFIIKNSQEIIGKTVIIVDDVITTGNTVKEASKVLKKIGAKTIFILVLAKRDNFL